jgi:N-methylhydantoinase A
MNYIVGVDIGGTFTDCVAMDERGTITIGKALSTPLDFSQGAIEAVRDAAHNLGLVDEQELLTSTQLFFHACTIGDNTLITRAGAKTALITTKGFGDTLLIMRGRNTDGLTSSEVFHVSAQTKPEPFIPRRLIYEVTERIDYKGSTWIDLDSEEAEGIIDQLKAQGVESVAISLLWSVTNDAHEKALAKLIRERAPNIYCTLSSDVAPYLGEYERTATTAFNAYIGPKISSYLDNLQRVLKDKGLQREPLIMQSYGGVLGVDASSKNAVGTIESGPAAGVVGSRFLGDLMGTPNILATDMGGTTFKVSLISEGRVEKDYKPVLLRYSIYSTKIWVESIGAGGGSIAWVEPTTGLLKVGPDGAGARPGPVCYGAGGTEPTVSDADLILGYLNPDYFLGGRMKLNRQPAYQALEEKIARRLKMTPVEAASGIYRIANSHMSDLIRRATVERGHDPREFTLFAYGGAGPVHAGRYAAELGIQQVIIPLTASVHCATGLVTSDVIYEYGKTDRLVVPAKVERVNANFFALVTRAREDLGQAGFSGETLKIARSFDMRYRYQVHELNVPLPLGTVPLSERDLQNAFERFDELYEIAYGKGSAYREAGKEIINFRLSATGELEKPRMKSYPLSRKNAEAARKDKREVYFEEFRKHVATDIYDFLRLSPGMEISGPAIIETPVTTVVVNPNDRATVDEFMSIRILIGA